MAIKYPVPDIPSSHTLKQIPGIFTKNLLVFVYLKKQKEIQSDTLQACIFILIIASCGSLSSVNRKGGLMLWSKKQKQATAGSELYENIPDNSEICTHHLISLWVLTDLHQHTDVSKWELLGNLLGRGIKLTHPQQRNNTMTCLSLCFWSFSDLYLMC